MGKRISLRTGNLLSLSLTALGLGLAFIPGFVSRLLSFFLLWYFTHCLAHYLVGRLVGISFSHYFITRSSIRKLGGPFERLAPPTLGIKVSDWGGSSGLAKFAMFSAGALASMLMPLIPSLALFLEGRPALLAVALINIAFTLYFSPRVGDFNKALKSIKNN